MDPSPEPNPPIAPVVADLVAPPPAKPVDPLIEIQQLRQQQRGWKGRFLVAGVAFVFLLVVSVLQFVGTFITCQVLFAARRDSERAQQQTQDMLEKLADAHNSLNLANQNLSGGRRLIGDLVGIEATFQNLEAEAARQINSKQLEIRRVQLLESAGEYNRLAERRFKEEADAMMKSRLMEAKMLLENMRALKQEQESRDQTRREPAATRIEEEEHAIPLRASSEDNKRGELVPPSAAVDPVRQAAWVDLERAKLRTNLMPVRLAAIQQLGKIGPPAASATTDLIRLFQNEPGEEIRLAVIECLGKFQEQGKEAIPTLIEAMESDGFGTVRAAAATGLSRMGPATRDSVSAMRDALNNEKDEEVKKAILAAIKRLDKEDATVAEIVSFDKHVLPIFEAKCGKCHIERTKGKLSLSSIDDIFWGGDSGPAIVPRHLEESVLWQMIETKAMPPPGRPRLTAVETDIIKRWIAARE